MVRAKRGVVGAAPYEGKPPLPLPLGEVAERQRGRRGFTRRDQGPPYEGNPQNNGVIARPVRAVAIPR